ncbi:hypothetical protein [Mycoplasma sp. 1232]|nr:hypothetical protein [Mycoplasma sp. 1232]MEA4333618.1 hypothetical protein [Mycoplasma sp. 1232]
MWIKTQYGHYDGFNIHLIDAKRGIYSKSDLRGTVQEVIITNYDI